MKTNYFLRIAASAAFVLVGGTVTSIPAFAQATKVNVCHATGDGGLTLISVASSALRAHLAHGDYLPGDTIPTGNPYSGLYGSTVTPVTVIGEDCSRSAVLSITSATMNYSASGWGGWSCLQAGYPKVVGGGYLPQTASVAVQGAAKPGAAAIGGYTYPVYPHYTFPSGEEGWVVQAGGDPRPTNVVVLCGQ